MNKDALEILDYYIQLYTDKGHQDTVYKLKEIYTDIENADEFRESEKENKSGDVLTTILAVILVLIILVIVFGLALLIAGIVWAGVLTLWQWTL